MADGTLLSLLILTLESRRSVFNRLHVELTRQIDAGGWTSSVEILDFADAGELSSGEKRNALLDRASGLFVAFIDDDDRVSPDYISLICETIQRRPDVDCIGIRGVITFRGSHPCDFIQSVRYNEIFSRNHTYYRPPCHFNPIRREIAARYRFPLVSYSEDFEWGRQIRIDQAIKTEELIDSPIYFYQARRAWVYQWLLDNTEGFRHKFGIRLANRLVLRETMQTAALRLFRRSRVDGSR